jgi:hypothetical protein
VDGDLLLLLDLGRLAPDAVKLDAHDPVTSLGGATDARLLGV